MSWGNREVDVRRRLRGFDLSIQKSRLQVDDILPQCIVFRFYVFVVLLQFFNLSVFLLQFLDITFLSLTECSLKQRKTRRQQIPVHMPSTNGHKFLWHRRHNSRLSAPMPCGTVWTLPVQPYFGQRASIATAPAWPCVRLRLGLRHQAERTSLAAWEPRWDARGEVERRLASYLPWERSQDS